MNLLSHLLEADAAKPRLTVYDEATDSRLDFSAVTLDNWAAKVGNMLIEEFDLDEDSRIAIDLPVSWQAVTIALGALAAHVDFTFGTTDDADVLFCSPDRVDASFTGDYGSFWSRGRRDGWVCARWCGGFRSHGPVLRRPIFR